MQQKPINPDLVQDLILLRDEIARSAFDDSGRVKDDSLAVVVWKINSCLFAGYPLRKTIAGCNLT